MVSLSGIGIALAFVGVFITVFFGFWALIDSSNQFQMASLDRQKIFEAEQLGLYRALEPAVLNITQNISFRDDVHGTLRINVTNAANDTPTGTI